MYSPLVSLLRQKCKVASCKALAYDGRTYCTVSHNHCEVLHQKRLFYASRGDDIGQYFADSMLHCCETPRVNSFQPITDSNQMPKMPRFKDLYELYLFLLPYEDVFHANLGILLDGSASVGLEDQNVRAQMIASELNPAVHRALRTMSGFYGFLLLVFRAILNLHGESYLRSLRLELVDIDDGITEWHKATLCCEKVTCLTEKIVDVRLPVNDNTYVYMNFCGIAESFDDVCEFLNQHPIRCMVSFTVQRAAKDYERAFIARSGRRGWRIEKVPSPRKDFVTYRVLLPAASNDREVRRKI